MVALFGVFFRTNATACTFFWSASCSACSAVWDSANTDMCWRVLLSMCLSRSLLGLAAQPTERAEDRLQGTGRAMRLEVFSDQFSATPPRAWEGEGGTVVDMVSNYIIVLPFKITQLTTDSTHGTLLPYMGLHVTTKHFGFTVIGAVQLDIGAPFGVGNREMALMLTDLDLSLAAMVFVGTVGLQLSHLPVGLLHEYASKVITATVRAGLVLLPPFIQTSLAILLPTAVDQVRLTQHFHANRASQLFRKRLDKLIVSVFTRSRHFELNKQLESHDLDGSDGVEDTIWHFRLTTIHTAN